MTRTCPTCGHELVSTGPPIPDDMPIVGLDLPGRLRSALSTAGILTVGNLRALSEVEILRIPEIGRISMEKLREIR